MLDPACGSGNFLYVSLLQLKDLEARVSAEAEALGLPPSFPEVGPEAVLGIEVNPYAAELARVSVWIGHIQWARRNGYPPPENPVLAQARHQSIVGTRCCGLLQMARQNRQRGQMQT